LLAEVARRAEVPVVSAQAFLPEREEPWALARSLLRETLAVDISAARALGGRTAQALAQILPEIEDVRPVERSALHPETWRALALEGAVRLVEAAAAQGTFLLVDDLQWADASSLVLLGSIMARVRGLPLVLAYRPEAIPPNETAARFLAGLPDLSRRMHQLPLGPLSPSAISQLVLDDALVTLIVEETDATPLAVTEVLRALVARRAVERDARRRWRLTGEPSELLRELVRTGMRRTIHSRAQRLRPGQRRILALLALLARGTPARLLSAATGEPQTRVLSDLDVLANAELVRLGEHDWVTAHDLIADVVAAALDVAERRDLHRMIAGALRADGSDAAELARHLAAAGDEEAAASAYAVAARGSLDHFAASEAERLATAGLALESGTATRSGLLEIRAEARTHGGDVPGAREDLRAALGSRPAGPQRPTLLVRLAQLASGADDMDRASALVDLALAEAGDDPETRAQSLRVGAIIDMNLGQAARSADRFEQALDLFEQCGNARGIADILDGRAMATLLEGKLPEAAEAFDRVARLFTDIGDLLRVAVPRGTRGWTIALMGRPREGLSDVEEALDLCRMLHHPDGEAYALVLRSLVLTALDRTTEAVECGLEARAIAERIGHKGWTSGAWWALGEARRAAGDPEQAVAAFRLGMEAAEGFPYFTSLLAGTLASTLVALGELTEAESLVARALALGTPMSAYWARQAGVELALARGDGDAQEAMGEALALAQAGGHMLSAARLKELATSALSVGAPVPGESPGGSRQAR
jgi:tetratricopeptide (TPR) repeat protein